VYNLTSSSVKRITFREMLDNGRRVVHDNPFEMMLWYPDGKLQSSRLVHCIYVIFLHFLPAYFIDLLLLVFRQKRL
jgi:fatty acyl-CoA reductase